MAIGLPIVSKFDDKGVKQAGKAIGDFGSGLKKIAGLLAAAFAIDKIKDFAVEAVRAAEEVATSNARLEQIASQMGLFGDQTEAATKRMIEFAEANEISLATDANIIKQTQAKLLTFKELAKSADETGGAFDRATLAAIDLAAAGFGEATSNATQLGKALQDPIKGISALTRVGVTFTAEQKKLIERMVASNDILGAQELILSAIEEQVGGTAEATANASEKMELAFGNVQDKIGEALLPVFEDLVEVMLPLIEDITPELQKFFEQMSPYLSAAVENFGELAKDALPKVAGFFEDLSKAAEGLGEFLGPIAKEALPALQNILASMEEPVAAVVEFLKALGETVLREITEIVSSQEFQDGMTKFGESLGILATEARLFVESDIGGSISDLGGPVVIGALEAVADGFEKVGAAMRVVRLLIEWFAGQRTLFIWEIFPGIDSRIMDGKEENFRRFIPGLASGGIVKARPGGTLALIGEGGQDEAVIPLGRNYGGDNITPLGRGAMMSNINITINAGVGSDPVAIGRYVTDAIKRYENVSGKVFARA